MNRIFLWLIATACCTILSGVCLAWAKKNEPSCIAFSYDDLSAIRKSIKAGKTDYLPAYNQLLKYAAQLLETQPEKVTDGDRPPTGDVHDFYSIGKFSWRNPNTPDGMPYIRGDGKYNEEAFGDRYDLTRFETTVKNVNILTLAWFYSGDERYAVKAGELLKNWFIDPETRMNPNMKCAAALPGVNDGLPTGIIFTVMLVEMTDHVQLLRLSKSWDADSDKNLRKWFAEYKTWLETSDFGKIEKAAKNNHGTWYAAQIVAYNLFIGEKDGMNEEFQQAKNKLSSQVMPRGELPLEIKRVEGFHYFIYGLKAFNVLANGLQKFGYDLWAYQTPDKKSLMLPYKYIIPYITREKSWTSGGVVSGNARDQIIMIKQAAARYDLPESKKAVDLLNAAMKPNDIGQLYIFK
ncbi:alginate lyase family protein [Desertivirga xinjiangensis]|uniref:alginate lyase family protein n=1 Tax=Desertivirga xinjiangensis TaxID=539206 RepID=UPI002109CF6D|nr:alginate lyase family protein [Pedobacter xinjiangensis]